MPTGSLSEALATRLSRRRTISKIGSGAVVAVAALLGFARDTAAAPACPLCLPSSATCVTRCRNRGYFLYFWDEGCYRCFECFSRRSVTGDCHNCQNIFCSARHGICA